MSVYAANGQGKMSATIVDPLVMTSEGAIEFCANQSYAAKCNIIRERVKKLSLENEQRQYPVNRQIISYYDYNILTKNFE